MDALPHKPQPRLFHAILVMVLLLCLAIGTLSVWRTLVQNETHRQQELLQQEVEGLARQMETRFDYQTDAIQRMARRWSDYRRHPPAWQRDADALLEDFDNIQAIEWLDASHCIRWIHPLQGNEPAVEFQYPDDHPNLPYLQIARESGQPVLSNQFELVQGGAGLAYQIPLYRDAGGNPQFDGYLIAIFRAEALVHSLLAELPTAHLSLTLEDRRGTRFQRLRADTHYSLPPAQRPPGSRLAVQPALAGPAGDPTTRCAAADHPDPAKRDRPSPTGRTGAAVKPVPPAAGAGHDRLQL